MMEKMEGHSEAYVYIRSMKTLREILEVAISFEKAARDFYRDLIPKVSKNIRYLVEELAEEEQEHFDLFAEMLSHPDVEEALNQRVQVPMEDHRFSDYVHVPELGDFPDDQEILQYAMGREDAAMNQVTVSLRMKPGPVKFTTCLNFWPTRKPNTNVSWKRFTMNSSTAVGPQGNE